MLLSCEYTSSKRHENFKREIQKSQQNITKMQSEQKRQSKFDFENTLQKLKPHYKIKKTQHSKYLHKSTDTLDQMENQTLHNHNQNLPNDSQEQQVVVFKFKRPFHQESFDQIKIHSKKIKANPQSAQKAIKNYQKRNFVDKQIMLANLFEKLELNPKSVTQTNEPCHEPVQKAEKEHNTLNSTGSRDFFLKKVQFTESANQSSQQAAHKNMEILNQMKSIKSHARKQDLEEKFDKLRNIKANSERNKRIKYKIIDIKQSNFVNFGGQNFEYEDLSNEFSESQKLSYKERLSKKVPQIVLPEQAEYLLEDQTDVKMQNETPENSESDSNREDRSDYEYPQEDYHEGDSEKSSEGVISGGRRRSPYDSDNEDEDLNNSYREQDEEEYYRQYLRRCKKQDEGDDQITYLYGLKSKYDDDSDD